jgi:hypothetical protein
VTEISEPEDDTRPQHLQEDVVYHRLRANERSAQRQVMGVTIVGLVLAIIVAGLAASALHSREEAALTLQSRIERTSPVLAVSPNKQLAVSQAGWLVDRGEPRDQLSRSDVNGAWFSPDSRLVCVAPREGGYSVWDSMTGRLLSAVSADHVGEVHFGSFTQDSERLTVSSSDGVFQYNVQDGKLTNSLSKLEQPVTLAAFSPNGQTVALAYLNSDLSISSDAGLNWKTVRTGLERNAVRAFAFDADNSNVLAFFEAGNGIAVDSSTAQIVSRYVGLTSR